ncbi:hypothetical protein [Pelotalea chapellei]|uniref:DUF5666 domain-containing protein n=1 Tax=Pelotalea chapellei TaxID=44671 RepID=A0ABS5UAI1_9BACT|nr:hypothetical protein [Pelotalea chapellei]MBT1072669.1 hypothetical protein [Pelotalea chapellei]
MKRVLSGVLVAAFMLVSVVMFSQTAQADEGKIVGTISKLVISADKKSATVVLKDIKSGEDLTVLITDDLTLDKFNDKRIVEGDEIRCKYEKDGGKNSSKMFKKTAGC